MYIKYIETTYYNMGHGLIMGNIILKRQSYLVVSMECMFFLKMKTRNHGLSYQIWRLPLSMFRKNQFINSRRDPSNNRMDSMGCNHQM